MSGSDLIDEVRSAWGWSGIEPEQVVGENDFGNLILRDTGGSYWRLCPEECTCEVVAANRTELDSLSIDQEFLRDWYMRSLVDDATRKLGPLTSGRKYCLKIPGLLGGKYDAENLAIAPLHEMIRISGQIAKQTQSLPEGATVRLKFSD
jgi:hypothetical protein